jgi:hypothetical protein
VAGGAEELAGRRCVAVGEDLGEALDAVLLHGGDIGTKQGFLECFRPAWTAAILAGMDPTSLDFWEWFYVTGNEGKSLSAEEMQLAIEERWHTDLVLIQDPKFPGTAGEFHGYGGLMAVNRELIESWDEIQWQPREVHDLGGDRYLVLIEPSAWKPTSAGNRRVRPPDSLDLSKGEGPAYLAAGPPPCFPRTRSGLSRLSRPCCLKGSIHGSQTGLTDFCTR